MTDISRRRLIATGLTATAGVAGLGLAARLAEKYGLIPPDHGGIYGLEMCIRDSIRTMRSGPSLGEPAPAGRVFQFQRR